MSKHRAEIQRIIANSDRHLTAEEIYLRLRNEGINISIATIYRNLRILSEQGIIKNLSVTGEADRFDRNVDVHDHIICERCGEIQDIYIEDLKKLLEDKTGITISSYDLCIKYICPRCLGSESDNT